MSVTAPFCDHSTYMPRNENHQSCAGCNDICLQNRDEAQALRGMVLYVRAAEREDIGNDDDTFYIQDLVGLRVELTSGEHVGKVVEVCDGTGTYDTLRILREEMVRSKRAQTRETNSIFQGKRLW